jgi:hypothetical protein
VAALDHSRWMQTGGRCECAAGDVDVYSLVIRAGSSALDADRLAMWMRWIIRAGCRPAGDVNVRRAM